MTSCHAQTGLLVYPGLLSYRLFILISFILISNSAATADSIPNSQLKHSQPPSPGAAIAAAVQPQQSPVDFSDFGGANTQQDSHEMWLALREKYFSGRPIIENGDNRIQLQAPARAENDALVPVLINLEDRKNSVDAFKQVYLIVDVNPAPLGGLFKLSSKRAMQQLKTSVRVNGYTYIRAVGETANGKLFMDKQWVKSTGAGCSAPPGLDQEMHKKRLGKIRFNQIKDGSARRSQSLRLVVSHPNNTGMQRDQLSTLMIPEHYITHIKVTFNQDTVLEADTSFTISENPNLTFTFDPEESGILRADLTDNLDNFFSSETYINAQRE